MQHESTSDPQSKSNKTQQTLFAAVENQLAKHAEVMWAVELVMYKQSFRSCDNKSNLFSATHFFIWIMFIRISRLKIT